MYLLFSVLFPIVFLFLIQGGVTQKKWQTTECKAKNVGILCSSSRSIRFKWEKEVNEENCKNYPIRLVSYKKGGTKPTTNNTVELSDEAFTFQQLKEDTDYKIKFNQWFIANDFTQLQVKDAYLEYNARTHGPQGTVKLVLLNVYQNSANVSWSAPAHEAKCTLRYKIEFCPVEITVQACKSENKWLENNTRTSYTLPISEYIDYYHYQNGLDPVTKYTVKVTVVTTNYDLHQSDPLEFSTSIPVPPSPKNVAVSVNNTELSVSWDPVDSKYGTIMNYTVTVHNQVRLYSVEADCPGLEPIEKVVDGSTTQAVIKGLLPNLDFLVDVHASNHVGRGSSSSSIRRTTPPGVSEPVRNVTVIETDDEFVISWLPPCNTGGDLEGYRISLNGTRKGRTAVSWEKLSLTQQLETVVSASKLSPDSNYSLTVTPVGVNKLDGKVKPMTLSVSARIPAKPNASCLPDVKAFRTTAEVSIRSNLFPDTEGFIRFYAILVAANFSDPPASGRVNSSTNWTNTATWAQAVAIAPLPPYQATPMYWAPFQDLSPEFVEARQFELGTQECSLTDKDSYCNGPLQPDTFYAFRIRGFTTYGYRDTDTIEFRTGLNAKPRNLDKSIVINVVIIILLIVFSIIIIFFSYLTCRNNIKSKVKDRLIKGKWREEKMLKMREPMTIQGFLEHAGVVLSSDDMLLAEYNDLKKISDQNNNTQEVARLPHNRKKNRYANILPYDFNRVILEGDEMNEYINASHIEIKEAKAIKYIACQGPRESECEHFWRMVVQYHVSMIVMLCMPVEKGREKCFVYYPAKGALNTYGDITIRCVDEEEFPNYVIRSLTAEDKDGRYSEVQQFHFTEWPDFGTPNSPQVMVEFVEAIRQVTKQKESVLTVHCSAGVGRTGTFIALHVLLKVIRQGWNCKVNVFDMVLQLRVQRNNMVQTEGQYEFIYKCLKFAIDNHDSLFVRVGKALSMRSHPEPKRSETDIGELLEMEELPEH